MRAAPENPGPPVDLNERLGREDDPSYFDFFFAGAFFAGFFALLVANFID